MTVTLTVTVILTLETAASSSKSIGRSPSSSSIRVETCAAGLFTLVAVATPAGPYNTTRIYNRSVGVLKLLKAGMRINCILCT